MKSDNRKYRLNDEQEIDALVKRYGQKFLQFKSGVYHQLEKIPAGTFIESVWIEISSLVTKNHLLPAFIKCACLFMLERNAILEFWEYDEFYTRIRHIKEKKTDKIINDKAIHRWYEKR